MDEQRRRSVVRENLVNGVRMWWFKPRWLVNMDDDNLPVGPWDNEPDKIQWIDERSDYDCLMLRSAAMGNWCGYVGVPPTHGLFGGSRHEVRQAADEAGIDLQVHGGRLTFADSCAPGEPVDGICHVAAPGRVRSPWWFGFDCGHPDDDIPGLSAFLDTVGLSATGDSTYRGVAYVMGQCSNLALQLHALTGSS